MNREIFNNDKVQILYDEETGELSFGFYPQKFTPYEHWLLAKAFDLVYDDEEEENE